MGNQKKQENKAAKESYKQRKAENWLWETNTKGRERNGSHKKWKRNECTTKNCLLQNVLMQKMPYTKKV